MSQLLPSVTPPRRRVGLIVGVVAALIVLIAASATGTLLLTRTVRTTITPPVRTSAPPSVADLVPEAPFSAPLQTLVVPMPAGATDAPKERKGAADGTMNLVDVIDEYADPDQQTISDTLRHNDFQRGVFIAWRNRGTLVYIQIYQFRHEDGAALWSVGQQHGIEGDATSTAYFDEIEGGRWFVTDATGGRGAAHAYFSKGVFAVMIDTFTPGAADVDGTRKLAVDQYARLP